VHGQRENINSTTARIWALAKSISIRQITDRKTYCFDRLSIKLPKMTFSAIYPDVKIPEVDLWGLMFEKEREENFPLDKSELTETKCTYYTH
jgi:hypothetical protein